jgi:hypothetical protein
MILILQNMKEAAIKRLYQSKSKNELSQMQKPSQE